MSKWKCNNCETINDGESYICEVCEGKAPYISNFEYRINEELGIIECFWIAENYNCLFCQLNNGALFEPQGNKHTFNVSEQNIIRIIVENEIARVVYDYPINVSNISVNNKIEIQSKTKIAEQKLKKIKKQKKEISYVSKLIISILLTPIWLLLMVIITAIVGQNDVVNMLGLLPLAILAYYFVKAICN